MARGQSFRLLTHRVVFISKSAFIFIHAYLQIGHQDMTIFIHPYLQMGRDNVSICMRYLTFDFTCIYMLTEYIFDFFDLVVNNKMFWKRTKSRLEVITVDLDWRIKGLKGQFECIWNSFGIVFDQNMNKINIVKFAVSGELWCKDLKEIVSKHLQDTCFSRNYIKKGEIMTNL